MSTQEGGEKIGSTQNNNTEKQDEKIIIKKTDTVKSIKQVSYTGVIILLINYNSNLERKD